MALQKNKTTEYNVVANYWRVEDYQIAKNDILRIKLALYLDATTAGVSTNKPLYQESYEWTSSELPTWITDPSLLDPVGKNIVNEMYLLIKAEISLIIFLRLRIKLVIKTFRLPFLLRNFHRILCSKQDYFPCKGM